MGGVCPNIVYWARCCEVRTLDMEALLPACWVMLDAVAKVVRSTSASAVLQSCHSTRQCDAGRSCESPEPLRAVSRPGVFKRSSLVRPLIKSWKPPCFLVGGARLRPPGGWEALFQLWGCSLAPLGSSVSGVHHGGSPKEILLHRSGAPERRSAGAERFSRAPERRFFGFEYCRIHPRSLQTRLEPPGQSDRRVLTAS